MVIYVFYIQSQGKKKELSILYLHPQNNNLNSLCSFYYLLRTPSYLHNPLKFL